MTLVLSAGAAIFAGLIGTSVLDVSNSTRWMLWADHAAVVLWVPALLLLAYFAYLPNPRSWTREAAWISTSIAGAATLFVLLFTGFGFTRDTDRVRLLLTDDGVNALRTLCGPSVDPRRIDGTIRTSTLHEDFVIFDLAASTGTACTHSLDLPKGEILAIQEDPPATPRS